MTIVKGSIYYPTGCVAINLKNVLMVCKVVVWIIYGSNLLYLALPCIENYDVYGLPSILSSSDEVLSMSAIYPAVYSLKHLLFNPPSDAHVFASHLLKYIQRLSFVTIRDLKPLVDFASHKVKRLKKFAKPRLM